MAATLLSTWERRQRGDSIPVSCKRRDVLRLSLSDYRQVADRLMKGYKQAVQFLIGQRIFKPQDIPYQTQIIPLAAILTALDKDGESITVRDKLARWFWCGVFGELYGSTVESRFAKDIAEVFEWVKGGPEPSTVMESNFAPQRLLGLKTRNSAAYKGLSALVMREGGLDFITGDTILLQTYFDDNMDIHHIFPQKYCNATGIPPKLYNCVINKTPISARTNRIIGGNPPSDYLGKLQKKYSISTAKMDGILQSHLIDPALLRADDFDGFFNARRESLLSMIENAMGKSIARDAIVDEAESDEEDEAEPELMQA